MSLLVKPCNFCDRPVAKGSAVACQAPMFIEFSRQEYWSGLPLPIPGHLPDPRMEPGSPMSLALASGFFTIEPPGKLPIF